MVKKFAKRLLALVLAVSMVNFSPTAMTVQAEETTTESTVIDVTDFGADPSGKNDSTEAVMAALEEAKTIEGSKTLSFPYGEYRFDEDHSTTRVYHTSNTSSRSYPEKKIAILLEEADDLTIEGNGSTLLVYGDIMALAVVESSNIKIQNLVLDYKDADTIDISVVKTGEDENGNPYADIFVPAAYNYVIFEDAEGGKHIQWQGDISAETGEPYWTWDDADFCAYLVVYKGYDRTVIRANDKAASNPFTGVTNITPSGDATVRFTYESKLPTDIVEGNIYQLSNSAWRQTAGAFFWESEGLTVENIDVHYLSGFGWLTQMCMDVEFKGVDFLPRDGSGKYTTSNADQLHVSGCGGYFKVTDCNFSMAHDDPINVHGTYMRVEEVIDARTVRLKYIHGQQGGFRQFHEGDEVLFYSRTYLEAPDGQVEDQPFIVESSVGPGEAYTGPAEAYDGTTLDLVTEIVTFKEDLPAETIADLQKTITKNDEEQALYVAENVTYTPAVTIRGNRMKSIPTRGILCTTRQEVIIEENIFDNMAMASIYLSNDADDWYESGPIRNLTIRNNVFYIRPTGQGAVGTVSGVFIEPITIGTWAMTGGETQPKDPDALVHENITITGNTFYISNDNVVTANRVDGLTITNNTIIHDDDIAIAVSTKGELGVGESQDIAVDVTEKILEKDVFQFNDCTNVTVSGNTYDEGMNLNVEMSKMDAAADLTLGESDAAVLTVNQGENKVSSASKVHLISSNPDVAYVDEKGKLVGVSAGTTTVQAYIEKNGALIRSNEVTVAVGDSLAAGLTLTADDTFFENENDPAALNTRGTEVVYQVLDPVSGKTSDKAIVTENTYIAKKDGAVIVKATAANGDTAELLMINSFGVSYDKGSELAEGVEVLNETAENGGATNFTETSVTITSAGNGNALAEDGTGKTADNIVSIAIPAEMQSDLKLRVKASGLTPYGNGYGSSGVMLFTGLDNYFFAGRRAHYSGISTMYENAADFNENNSTNSHTETTVAFEFIIAANDANNLIVNYLLDGATEWANLGTYDISYLRGEGKSIKLGLVSWLNSETTAYNPTFSEIQMSQYSGGSTVDMSAVSAMTLSKAAGPNVENPTENGTIPVWKDAVQIVPQANGNGITPGGSLVNNVVNLEIPADMETNLRLLVDAEGLVKKAGGWSSSGVMLYTDFDNYLFAGKRNHFEGIATMTENAGSFTEGGGDSSANDLTATTFEFVIRGTTATVSYLDANGNWQKEDEFEIAHIQNGNMKLGLVSWLNGGDSFTPVYSNIRMATADVSRDDMLTQEPVSLYGAIANARPAVGEVTINEDNVTTGTKVTVNVSADDADGSISSYLYQWNLETANGTEKTYTTVGEYTPNVEGKLTVGVIAFDNYNKPSEIKLSAEKDVTATLNTGNELGSLYVNGNKVEGLAGGTGVAYVPAGTEKIRISYDKADSGVETTINGTTTIAEGSNSAVVALADTYTITRGDVTYTLNVYAVESSDNALKAITVGTQSIDLADEIKAGTDSYFVQVEKDADTLPLVIESAEGSTIKVTRSYYEKEVADVDTNKVEAEIAMTAGINAYYIYITAADGVSTREVKLYLYADGYADCDLTEIKVNGAAIEGFDPATEAYTIHITAEQAENMEIEVSSKDGQQTSITYAGSRTEGNEAAFALTENFNEIIIANVAKDMWSKHFYTLNVIVDRDDNADLLTLTTDTGFGAAFEPDTNAYVLALNTDGRIAVTATAQMTEANIRMYVGDELQATEAKGTLTGEFTLYEGENRISVVVTAPDGTTVNTYTLDVPAKGCVYASDVIAAGTKEGITSTTVEVGYGSVNLDGNVGGSGKIALPDESGNKVVFDKGIGAHASSEIVFNLEEGHEFTAFEAYAGIDYVQYNTNQSSVNFQVWVDGELKWESGETGAQTPMQFVSVDVVGASEVKLVIDELDWNGYDHSEWADACFIRSFEKAPDVPAENVVRNTVTSAEYATVQEAMEAAEAGQTIILLVDHTEATITALPGVTLDLNGHELTASYVVGFDTAHIVDSIGDGRLVTGVENVVLDEENAMAAIYDGEGYLFTKAGFAVRRDSKYTGEGFKIQAIACPVQMAVVDLLKDGGADNNIEIVIRLTWDTDQSTGSQDFKFNDAVVASVYSSNNGTFAGYSKMFSMVVTGFENIENLKANIVVVSGTDAEYVSSTSVDIT